MATISLTPQYYNTSATLTNGRYTLNPGTSTSYYVTIPASSTIDLCDFGLDYFETNNTVSSYELYITIYNTWQTILILDENDIILTSIDKDINGSVLPTGWSSTTPTTNVQRFLIPFSLLSGNTVGKIRIITSSSTTCRFYGARLNVTYTSSTSTTHDLPYGYYRKVLTPTSHTITSSTYVSSSNCLAGLDNTAPSTISSVPSSDYSGGGYYIGGFDFSQIPHNAKVVKWRIRVKGFTRNVDRETTYSNTITLPQGEINTYSGRFYLMDYNTNKYINLYSRGIPPKEDKYVPNPPGETALYDYEHYNESKWYVTQVMGYERNYGGELLSWEELKSYGSNLYLKITLRNTTSGQPCFLTLYGVEIEVIYYIHPNVTIDIATKDPDDIQIQFDDEANVTGASVQYNSTHTLRITPPNNDDYVTVLENYKPLELTGPLAGGTYAFTAELGQYNLISGSFSGSGSSYFQSIVGNGYNASQTTSNYYSSGSNVQAVFTYDIGMTHIPSNATITDMYLEVNGHAENATQSSEYMCVQLKSGNTYFSNQYNFKSAGTSNTTQTITATKIPTFAELAEMKVECTLGYYGGAINGATLTVRAEVPDEPEWSYTFTATEDTNFIICTDTSTTAINLKTLTLQKTGTGLAKFEPFQPGIQYKIPYGTEKELKITPSCRMRPVFLKVNNIDVTNQLIHNTYSDIYEIASQNYYDTVFSYEGSHGYCTEFNVLKGEFTSATAENSVRKDIMLHLTEPRISDCRAGSSEHLLLSFEIGILLPPTAHIEDVYWAGTIQGGASTQAEIEQQYFNYRVMSGNKTILDFKKDFVESGASEDYTIGNTAYSVIHTSNNPVGRFITVEDVANLTFEIEVGTYGGKILPGIQVFYKDHGDNYVYTLNCNQNLTTDVRVDSWHEVMQKTNNGWSALGGPAHAGGTYFQMGTSSAVYKNNHWEDAINLIQTYKNAGPYVIISTLNYTGEFNPENNTIYTNTPLTNLKEYLTIYHNYTDGQREIVPNDKYTISGILTAGTSTIYIHPSDTYDSINIEIPNVIQAS